MTASLELGGHQNPRAWQGAVKELAKKKHGGQSTGLNNADYGVSDWFY